MNRMIILVLVTLLVIGCSVQRIEEGVTLPRSERWVLLPIVNYAQMPRAGERIEALVETELRLRGLDLARYPSQEESELLVPSESRRYENALEWAKRHGYRYGVTGSVNEWRYKAGLDGEPAVGVSLRVIEISSGRILWSASGARTGWGYESLSGVAAKLIAGLLRGLRLENRR